jgi:hypothetical protein
LLLNGAGAWRWTAVASGDRANHRPMYQLFIFFMITDPRTPVRGRRSKSLAVLIAVMETLIRFASKKGWPLPTAFNVAAGVLCVGDGRARRSGSIFGRGDQRLRKKNGIRDLK